MILITLDEIFVETDSAASSAMTEVKRPKTTFMDEATKETLTQQGAIDKNHRLAFSHWWQLCQIKGYTTDTKLDLLNSKYY